MVVVVLFNVALALAFFFVALGMLFKRTAVANYIKLNGAGGARSMSLRTIERTVVAVSVLGMGISLASAAVIVQQGLDGRF